MYAVIGATGNTGHWVTEILLAHAQTVRAIGRSAEKLQPLVDKGAEAWVGSAEDAEFLTRAFAGVEGIYTMLPTDVTAPDLRAYQNRLGEAIATAIKAAGVKYVVNLSSLGANLDEGTGPILGLHDQEERLNGLSRVHVLHLRPTYFMENLLANIPVIKQMGVHGSLLSEELVFPLIALRDVSWEAAQRLLSLDFPGHQAQPLLGERDLSMLEITAVLGAAIGKPDLKYVQFAEADVERSFLSMGFSPDVTRAMLEMNRCMNEGRFTEGVQRDFDNATPTSIEKFSKAFAAAYNVD